MTLAPYPIPYGVVTPCAADPDLMFADRKSAPVRLAKAKEVCAPCDYREGCLMWAVTRGEEGVWAGTDEKERQKIAAKLGIVPVRPTLNLPRTVSTRVPHGTAVGVEVHRKRYMPLCDECAAFEAGRYPVTERVACGDCGTVLLPASLRKHQRRYCPAREEIAS